MQPKLKNTAPRDAAQERCLGTLRSGTTLPTPLTSSNPSHQGHRHAPMDHLASAQSEQPAPKTRKTSPRPNPGPPPEFRGTATSLSTPTRIVLQLRGLSWKCRSFPLNTHSRPFTPASVASSEGDSKGEAAPEDVLHSPYEEDKMHKISPTDRPGASTLNSLSKQTAFPVASLNSSTSHRPPERHQRR